MFGLLWSDLFSRISFPEYKSEQMPTTHLLSFILLFCSNLLNDVKLYFRSAEWNLSGNALRTTLSYYHREFYLHISKIWIALKLVLCLRTLSSGNHFKLGWLQKAISGGCKSNYYFPRVSLKSVQWFMRCFTVNKHPNTGKHTLTFGGRTIIILNITSWKDLLLSYTCRGDFT